MMRLISISCALSMALILGCSKDKGGDKAGTDKPDTTKPDEAKPDEAKPDEAKPDEAKPDEPDPATAVKCGATPCPCEEGSKNKEGDDWSICKLSAATEIQGMKCAAGRVVFYDDGKLHDCNPAEVVEVSGYKCKASPLTVKLYKSGKLEQCSAAEATEIDGYTINAHQSIALFEDGKLMSAFLKDETKEIDGVPCTGGLRWFASGKLRMCTLATDHAIEKNKLKAKTMVVWHESGAIRGLWNEKPIKWAGKSYNQKKRGNWLCFKDGKPDPEGFNCNSF